MKLIEFPEQTCAYAENQPEYKPLPAHKFNDGRIVCCWKLSWRERLAIVFRGIIWHQILTFNHPIQPQLLTTDKPAMAIQPHESWPKMEKASA